MKRLAKMQNEEQPQFVDLRRRLHEAINDVIKEAMAVENEPPPMGVTGWILIAEYTSGSDQRNLLAISGDIVGGSDLPHWTARGWIETIGDDISFYLGGTEENGEEE